MKRIGTTPARNTETTVSPVEASLNRAAMNEWESEGGPTSTNRSARDRMAETTIAIPDARVTRLRVLIADDDEETLRTVAAAVELLSADVTRASTGGELLEHLGAEDPFDLIITDVSMPWMTGLQVMHSVRTAGLRTPVVVITALRVPSVDTQASTLGENAVLLHKPFDVEDLHAAIGTVLGRPVVAADQSGATAP